MKLKWHIGWACGLAVWAAGTLTGGAAPAIALVRGEFTARQSPAQARGVAAYHQTVKDCLTRQNVAFDELSDSEVAAGKLAGHRLAILTYNVALSETETGELDKFMAGGGKLIVFYAVPPRLGPRLGVRLLQHEQSDPPGLFSAMKFKPGLVTGVPELVPQASWNINFVEVTTPRAQVLAEWIDHTGQPTGRPAWVLSTNGAWMSHVLLPGESLAKERMLVAILGHFLPEVWEKAARACLPTIGRIGPCQSLDDLDNLVASARIEEAIRQEARRDLEKARAARQRGLDLLTAKRYGEALAAGNEALQYARQAYGRLQPSKAGEFRGAWIHSGYGIDDRGWDRTVATLKTNGFNAIFANLLWAGLAHYPRALLPVADRVATQGDQVARCLEACRKHGVELHVWKVNHNLSTAPSNFVARLRAAGRLQQSRDGEEIDWLCPSHPDNFALERDSMLEVARRYAVDGLHFDYIRYPNANACYCAGCRARFEAAAGVKLTNWPADVLSGPLLRAYGDWRRAQITRLVRAVSEEARRIRPGLKVSAAVFGDWESCRHQVGQDWKAWIDEGLLDFVCPMDYDTSDGNFAALVRHQVGWVNRKVPLYPGVGAYRLASPEDVIRQIQITRELGVDGFVLFQLDAQLADEVLPDLRLGATRLPPR